MRVIVYAPSAQKAASTLAKSIETVIPNGMAEIYEGVEELYTIHI